MHETAFAAHEGAVARLDLIDLALFRHVVEAGSITAGAARANLALAAASTRIRQMEDALGVRLLERRRTGITPTPAGHALAGHARAILAQSDRLHEDLHAYSGDIAGHVRVLSNTNALTEFLPDVLGRFLAAFPGATVDLQERLSDEIVGLVADGTADLGIVAGTVDTGSLETYAFRSDRFVLVADAHWTGGASVAFADVLDRDFVGLDQASALQRFLAARAAPTGHRLRLRVQLRSFDAVCRMVEAGVGVGVVPETTARRAAQTMSLTVVPLEDDWALRDLRICVRDLDALSPSARQLMRHLTASVTPERNP